MKYFSNFTEFEIHSLHRLVFCSLIFFNPPMRAVQLVAHGVPGTFQLVDIPKPVPAPDEVLVQVKACGLNRLDLWAEEAGLPIKLKLPRILGGEISGVIAELGDDVDQWRIGQRVAIQSNLFCGTCEYCLKGDESICLNGSLLGVDRDGGFAEYVSVPARALVAIPAGLDFAASAALTLAGSTAMHMLTNRTEVRSADWVLVMAAGSGVGTYAIQIAKQLGAQVITTGSTEAKRAFGTTLGADFVLDSNDSTWPAQVREITKKRGVDLVVEHVGGEVFEKCFQCLARGGVVVTCGATAGRSVQMNLWPLFVKQQCVIGSYGRNRADIEATLDWAAQSRIRPIIHQTFPLERISEGFGELRSRAVLGKVVITP
jgi:NADPH:quinone reductase-like Zn-dependent oxidoreductase